MMPDPIDRPSPNFDSRPAGMPVDMLVLHYTGMKSADAALARLTDADAKVSAHYLIEEDGNVFKLVAEEFRAWHAGVSYWRGLTDINARSIGIELVNPGHEFGYRRFPEPQMASLETLAREILTRHPVPPRNVVGHSDVAPARKSDPGELFDWRRLAAAGVGLWPDFGKADCPAGDAVGMLTEIGYDTGDVEAAITAFQRHFLASNITGHLDPATRQRIVDVTGAAAFAVAE